MGFFCKLKSGFSNLFSINGLFAFINVLLLTVSLIYGFIGSEQSGTGDNSSITFCWRFYFSTRPFMSLVIVVLAVNWWLTFYLLCKQFNEAEVIDKMGKTKILLMLGCNLALSLIALVIVAYYVGGLTKDNNNYKKELIFLLIASILLVLSNGGQAVWVLIRKRDDATV